MTTLPLDYNVLSEVIKELKEVKENIIKLEVDEIDQARKNIIIEKINFSITVIEVHKEHCTSNIKQNTKPFSQIEDGDISVVHWNVDKAPPKFF